MSVGRTKREAGERRLPPEREAEFLDGLAFVSEFFMGQANVHRALTELVQRLESAGIPYAVVGAMALNEYGYRRATVDVDVLLTPEGLAELKSRLLGRGYLEHFPGSLSIRDTVNRVDIDVVLTGDFPGDGLPKPVAFPDPAKVAIRGEQVALLPLPALLELKLASGMTAPHRLRDLADVLEVIRALGLPRDLADTLSAYVRPKYLELWDAAQTAEPER